MRPFPVIRAHSSPSRSGHLLTPHRRVSGPMLRPVVLLSPSPRLATRRLQMRLSASRKLSGMQLHATLRIFGSRMDCIIRKQRSCSAPTPNQAMERTADRCASHFEMTSTLLHRATLSSAAAHLVDELALARSPFGLRVYVTA